MRIIINDNYDDNFFFVFFIAFLAKEASSSEALLANERKKLFMCVCVFVLVDHHGKFHKTRNNFQFISAE